MRTATGAPFTLTSDSVGPSLTKVRLHITDTHASHTPPLSPRLEQRRCAVTENCFATLSWKMMWSHTSWLKRTSSNVFTDLPSIVQNAAFDSSLQTSSSPFMGTHLYSGQRTSRASLGSYPLGQSIFLGSRQGDMAGGRSVSALQSCSSSGQSWTPLHHLYSSMHSLDVGHRRWPKGQ